MKGKKKMDIKFRTITNLKNFSDNEVFEPETSETEPGQAVDIKSVYLRCLRGEITPVRPGGFDIKPGMTVDEAFDTLDPTQSEGFDLADATVISNHLNEKLVSEELSPGKTEAASSIASDSREPVENSEATAPEK